MSNELTLSAAVAYLKSDESFDAAHFDLIGQRLTVAGTKFIHGTQTATTSQAALALGSVGTPGLIIVKNRGAVTIKIRSGSGGSDVVCIPPGLGFWFILATATPWIVVLTDSAVLEYLILEA